MSNETLSTERLQRLSDEQLEQARAVSAYAEGVIAVPEAVHLEQPPNPLALMWNVFGGSTDGMKQPESFGCFETKYEAEFVVIALKTMGLLVAEVDRLREAVAEQHAAIDADGEWDRQQQEVRALRAEVERLKMNALPVGGNADAD